MPNRTGDLAAVGGLKGDPVSFGFVQIPLLRFAPSLTAAAFAIALVMPHAHAAASKPSAPVDEKPQAEKGSLPAGAKKSSPTDVVQKLNKAQDAVKKTGSQPCPSCDVAKAGHATAPKPKPKATPFPPIELKEMPELEAYIDCFEKNKDNKKEYFRLYKHYIKAAAEEFRLPEQFLTCLIFRESRFKRNAKSDAGAVGLGQFMPKTTIPFIDSIVKMQNMKPEQAEKYWEGLRNDKKNAEYYGTLSYNHGLGMQWKAYFERIHKAGKYKSPTPPTRVATGGAYEPSLAIGMSALYLRFIIDFYQKELNETGEVPTGSVADPEPDFLITVGGSYNIGHGAARRILEKADSNTTYGWRAALQASNPETRNQMRAIEVCMQKGTKIGMPGDENIKCEEKP